MEPKSFIAGFAVAAFFLLLAVGIAGVMVPQKTNANPECPQASPITIGNSQCPSVQALFSPDSSDEIISLMRSAKDSIDLEMYVFTDDVLARELVDAQRRGVKVRVILESRVESTASTKTIPDALLAGGVEVKWASVQYALTHSKMMIIDGKKVLVGSINFSKNAQHKNREAAAIIESAQKVSEYEAIFQKDWQDGSLAG